MRGSRVHAATESAPCNRRRSPDAAGRLRFAWPPLEAPSGRGGAGGCGGTGDRGESVPAQWPRRRCRGGSNLDGSQDVSPSLRAPPSLAARRGDLSPNPGCALESCAGIQSHFGEATIVSALRAAQEVKPISISNPTPGLGKFSG